MYGNPIRLIDPTGEYGLACSGLGCLPIDWPNARFPDGPFGPICGSEGSTAATYIPDFVKKACKKHDICYDSCARRCEDSACKLVCDGELASSLPLYGLATALGGGDTYDNLLEKYNCNDCE